MPFAIVRNDIVNMSADAIVNTANPKPVIGSGVDSSIHKAAGPALLQARQVIGPLAPGDAAITPGYQLDAKYVIHTAGPVWIDGKHQEEALLASCYRKSLALAKAHHCASIAFPLISTGNYGFPQGLALQIAIREFSAFLLENDMQIYLVVFGHSAFALSEKLVSSVASYIDEHYVQQKTQEEYGQAPSLFRRLRDAMPTKECPTQAYPVAMECPQEAVPFQEADLHAALAQLDAGFSETVLKWIDASGKKDAQIYKKALLTKQHFSKIRNNPHYKPTKQTAVALALALELNLEDARDLLSRAGYALSNSSKFDLIIRYCIEHKCFDLVQINCLLYDFDQPLLGSVEK